MIDIKCNFQLNFHDGAHYLPLPCRSYLDNRRMRTNKAHCMKKSNHKPVSKSTDYSQASHKIRMFDRFAYDFAVTTKIFSRALILRRAMFYLNFGHAKKFAIILAENTI